MEASIARDQSAVSIENLERRIHSRLTRESARVEKDEDIIDAEIRSTVKQHLKWIEVAIANASHTGQY
mgnify:CR=1 FL=1